MKYKNVSKKDLLVVGIGLVKSGAIRNMPVGFHNINFEKVSDKPIIIKKDNK